MILCLSYFPECSKYTSWKTFILATKVNNYWKRRYQQLSAKNKNKMQNPLIFSELLRQLLLGMSLLTDVQNTHFLFFFSFCQVNSKLNNLKTRHADFFFFFNHLSKHLKKNKVKHHILLGIKHFLLIGMLLCCIWYNKVSNMYV